MWKCGLELEALLDQLDTTDRGDADTVVIQAAELNIEFMLLLAGVLDARRCPDDDIAA